MAALKGTVVVAQRVVLGSRFPKVVVHKSYRTLFVALMSLFTGIGLMVKVVNTGNRMEDPFWKQGCPVLQGRLHRWLWNVCLLLILGSIAGIFGSGAGPQLLLNVGLKDEAVCFGQMCMGLGGKILSTVLFFAGSALVGMGCFVLVMANRDGLQSQRRWPRSEAEKYCDSVLVGLAYALLAIFAVGLGGLTCRSLWSCLEHHRLKTELPISKQLEALKVFDTDQENILKVLRIEAGQQSTADQSNKSPV